MPIRNSMVPSAEVFNIQRKKRLTRARGQSDDVADQTHDRADPTDTKLQEEVSAPQEHSDHVEGESAAADSRTKATSVGPDEAQEDRREAEQSTTEPQLATSPLPDSKRAKVQESASNQDGDEEQLRLQMTLPYPAAGASATFDQLVEVQSEKGAFRLVLGKALELYAASVADGTFTSAPTRYPESPMIARTSRMFSKAAYAVLEKELNRTGLLSERAMGTAIARRALAAFIASDKDPI